jgi:hypothetical protein
MEVQGKLAEDRRLVPKGQTLAVAEVKRLAARPMGHSDKKFRTGPSRPSLRR